MEKAVRGGNGRSLGDSWWREGGGLDGTCWMDGRRWREHPPEMIAGWKGRRRREWHPPEMGDGTRQKGRRGWEWHPPEMTAGWRVGGDGTHQRGGGGGNCTHQR